MSNTQAHAWHSECLLLGFCQLLWQKSEIICILSIWYTTKPIDIVLICEIIMDIHVHFYSTDEKTTIEIGVLFANNFYFKMTTNDTNGVLSSADSTETNTFLSQTQPTLVQVMKSLNSPVLKNISDKLSP